jgi:hypothetical protein
MARAYGMDEQPEYVMPSDLARARIEELANEVDELALEAIRNLKQMNTQAFEDLASKGLLRLRSRLTSFDLSRSK